MCVPHARVTQKGVVTEGEALGAGDHLTVGDRSRSVGRFLSQRGARPRGSRMGLSSRRDRRPFTQLSTLKCSQEVHVHIRKAAWRNVISALALVTFALPLATAPLAQSASAQSVKPESVV